jgi:esterase/lipase superfamily enzyme
MTIRDRFAPLRLSLGLLAILPAMGFSGRTVDLSIEVKAAAQARSDPFSLAGGDELTLELVTGTGAGEPMVNAYVYEKPGVLAARDDPDSAAPIFTWRAPYPGNYYVVLENTGTATGTVRIRSSATRAPWAVRKAPESATVRVFFVTDRNRVGSDPANSFGSEPSTLSYGYSDVSIPRDHRLGELEGPSIWRLELRSLPGTHVVVTAVQAEAERAFLDRVKARVASSRRKEALLFIHGFNVTFEDAMRRTAQIAYDLAFDGPAIAFSWPSQGSVLPLAYTRDQRNADLSAESLRRLLVLLGGSGEATLHVIAHSMGNRVLQGALQQLRESGPQTPQPLFREMALFAPDIDAELFKRAVRQIAKSATRVTLYASSRDGALGVAQRVAGYRRAGQSGSGLIVVPEVQTIDASDVDTSLLGLNHSYFADNRTILSDLFSVLRGVSPENRPSLTVASDPNGRYWRFKPAVR